MRAPSTARSLSYAAKPSWSSYQALQSQYVCLEHVKNSRKKQNSKYAADNPRPPTSRASSA